MRRVYLDHNATSPLRPEARAAMLAAMDALGNPSSVHSEGRAAKAIVEKARGQISEAFGVGAHDIVFTASATEAAALALPRDSIIKSANPFHFLYYCTVTTQDSTWLFLFSSLHINKQVPQGLGLVA